MFLPGREPRDAVLDDDDGTIDDQAEVQRTQAHEIARNAEPVHSDRCHQHGKGNDQRRDDRCPDVAQQQEQDRDHQKRAFDEILLDGRDRRIDQGRPVVDDLRNNSFRQGAANFLEPFGRLGRHGAAVLARAHEHGAHDRFIAVQRRRARSKVTADADRGDVPYANRHSLAGGNDRLLDILDAAEARIDPGEEGFTGPFDEIGPFGEIGRFQRVDHLVERQTVTGQSCGIGLDEILLFEAADGVDTCHTVDRPHERCNHPVLNGSQIGSLGNIAVEPVATFGHKTPVGLPTDRSAPRCFLAVRKLVLDGIHEHFAQAGRDGSHHRFGTLG